MTERIFDDQRNYVLGDPELELIGDRDKLGRKIVYRGCDLNDWVNANRFDPEAAAGDQP